MRESNLQRKVLMREVYGNVGPSSVKEFYGSRNWVENLDITNELYGHTGCVNALSWSRSGNLLASGSDDTLINIHTTTPTFAFNTSIDTGHKANIFSVKFMPFSDDRKIVSAAGDSEVRVFDIEYAPTGSSGPTPTAPFRPITPPIGRRFRGRRRPGAPMSKPAKLYSTSEAAPKVYTSHQDRVKRIVTESSPYLFLTCSEDGEVRQFDLRQPSSFYTRPSDVRGPTLRHLAGVDIMASDDHQNPPLISYKNQRIELSSISCSVGQPHYIALGGGHTYCFLHDRRMLGRNLSAEAGRASGPISNNERDLSAATRCVRRFAPPKVRANAHITACKISDAYPDELVVSWSGDKIYLFDINRSPDAEAAKGKVSGNTIVKDKSEGRVKENKTAKGKEKAKEKAPSSGSASGLKRKRSDLGTVGRGSRSSPFGPRIPSSKAKRGAPENTTSETEGGEGERDVLLKNTSRSPSPDVPGQSFMRIAGLVVDLRKELFGLASASTAPPTEPEEQRQKRSWTAALGLAKVCIERMDEVIEKEKKSAAAERGGSAIEKEHVSSPFTSTSFPSISEPRPTRVRARRYVQTAGTLARVLGGALRTLGSSNVALQYFDEVEGNIFKSDSTESGVSSSEVNEEEEGGLDPRYTFLKLILVFIEHGKDGIAKIAQRKYPGTAEEHSNLALQRLFDEGAKRINEAAADVEQPIVTVDDPQVVLYDSICTAWSAFRTCVQEEYATIPLDRKHWGLGVARALLIASGRGLDFSDIQEAFGENASSRAQRGEETLGERPASGSHAEGASRARRRRLVRVTEEDEEEEYMDLEDYLAEVQRGIMSLEEGDEVGEDELMGTIALDEEDEDDEDNEDDEDDDDIDDESEDDDDNPYGLNSEDEAGEYDEHNDDDHDHDSEYEEDFEEEFFFRTRPGRRRRPAPIEPQAPIWNSIRSYDGHCNVKTVKDVNFYGLDDEYIVSGSDCGHLFIWDKKTTKLVQLLHGDDDTVNVITGHPYLPQLAVSGIDHTVKIFSPDLTQQAEFQTRTRPGPRNDEEEMMDVAGEMMGASPGGTIHPMHMRSRSSAGNTASTTTTTGTALPLTGSVGCQARERSRRRLHDEYRVRAQNEAMRENGIQEALVTRTMLENLAARLRQPQGGQLYMQSGAGIGRGGGGMGGDIEEGERCAIS